jgi:hemolysin III
MEKLDKVKFYPPAEERINVWSHGLGLLLSVFGLVLLTIRAASFESSLYLVSFIVYGVSMVLLYAASTIYHSAKDAKKRAHLNIFDHASIYVLIAGTYTPLTLITLHGFVGWLLFGVAWGAALVGIILTLFFIGKYKLLSTIMYVVMGWIIVFAVQPLLHNMPSQGLIWLLAGGLSYTIGAVLYSIKGMKFNHAIFHLFVLIGSFCHFMTVYLYVILP